MAEPPPEASDAELVAADAALWKAGVDQDIRRRLMTGHDVPGWRFPACPLRDALTAAARVRRARADKP